MKILKGHKHAIRSLLALCIMCGIFTGLIFNTVSLYMEPVITEFPAVSRTQFSMIMTIAGATNAVLSLFAFGPLVEHLGLRRCIMLGVISVCAALFLFASGKSLLFFYISGLLLGVGVTFGAAGTASIGVTTWFKKYTATLLSIPVTCGFVSGIAFSPLVGEWILKTGWRMSLYITLVVSAVSSAAVILLYKDNPQAVGERPVFAKEPEMRERQEEGNEGVTFRKMFRTHQFYCLCVSYFIAGTTIFSVMNNMAIFSADYGFDSTGQGRILAVMFAASAVSMIPSGMLSDRYGTKATMGLCFGSLISALILLLKESESAIILYIAAALTGIAYVGTNGPAAISVREGLGTKEYNKKMPVVLGAMFAGVSAGNPILQSFYDINGSYRTGFKIYALLAGLAFILLLLGTKRAEKDTC